MTDGVVDKRVHRFLEDALFIAQDDIRRVYFFEFAQAIVAVDDTTIQVIYVARRIASAIERNHGTKRRRDDRDARQEHPLGADIGRYHRAKERETLVDALTFD